MYGGVPAQGSTGHGLAGNAGANGKGGLAASSQQAQMQAAMMRGFPGGYMNMYGGFAQGPPMQGMAGSAPSAGTVPGGGAADGGYSAAFAAWASTYGGGGGCYGCGGYGMPTGGGCGPKGCGKSEKGKGKGFGKGFGKGKGKNYTKGMGTVRERLDQPGGADGGTGSDRGGGDSADPRRQIEMAQRKAKLRDRSAITQAQRCAQQRFERDFLDRVQGYWLDDSDPNTAYSVEGSLCSVASSDSTRIFRNRLSVFGGELCWDARRFWHNLNLAALPPAGEQVTRVEWTPGEGSPPTKPIVWIRTEEMPKQFAAAAKAEGAATVEEDEEDEIAAASSSRVLP